MIVNHFSKPTIETVLRQVKNDTMQNINCVQVGKIHAFYPATQTADVVIQFLRIDSLALDGTPTYRNYPLLVSCPVAVLFGGEGAITFPITAGDSCIILFNDRELDQWFATGNIGPTITQRTHHISDGIAIVGINSLQTAIANYLTTGIRLAMGSTKIEITPALIASFATLFMHTGNMTVTGNVEIEGGLEVLGNVTGNGGTINIADNVVQAAGKTLAAGNGATGSFNIVDVVNGIVVGGS